MLETLFIAVFLAAFGDIPKPTPVVTAWEAEACLAHDGVIVGVYVGDTIEEAIDNQESFCFLPPQGVPEDRPTPDEIYAPAEPAETERQ